MIVLKCQNILDKIMSDSEDEQRILDAQISDDYLKIEIDEKSRCDSGEREKSDGDTGIILKKEIPIEGLLPVDNISIMAAELISSGIEISFYMQSSKHSQFIHTLDISVTESEDNIKLKNWMQEKVQKYRGSELANVIKNQNIVILAACKIDNHTMYVICDFNNKEYVEKSEGKYCVLAYDIKTSKLHKQREYFNTYLFYCLKRLHFKS